MVLCFSEVHRKLVIVIIVSTLSLWLEDASPLCKDPTADLPVLGCTNTLIGCRLQ